MLCFYTSSTYAIVKCGPYLWIFHQILGTPRFEEKPEILKYILEGVNLSNVQPIHLTTPPHNEGTPRFIGKKCCFLKTNKPKTRGWEISKAVRNA